MSDWMIVNVGGKEFHTTRSTFEADENSMLTGFFKFAKETKDDIPFFRIDQNPRMFEYVLEYLRNGCDIGFVLTMKKEHLYPLFKASVYYCTNKLTCEVLRFYIIKFNSVLNGFQHEKMMEMTSGLYSQKIYQIRIKKAKQNYPGWKPYNYISFVLHYYGESLVIAEKWSEINNPYATIKKCDVHDKSFCQDEPKFPEGFFEIALLEELKKFQVYDELKLHLS